MSLEGISEIEEDESLSLGLVEGNAESYQHSNGRPHDSIRQFSELAVREHLAFVQREKEASL